mgnify:CR=1 FL=1
MELTIALALSILGSVISVSTFVLNRKDKAIQNTKENHQELIEYQLKELKEDYKDIANDIKEIKKMLSNYRETFRDMIDSAMNDHIKQYHNRGV